MEDFIFGAHATFDKRVAQVSSQNRGGLQGVELSPAAPSAGQPVTVSVTIGVDVLAQGVVCHLLEPEPMAIPLAPVSTEWDTLNWGYYQRWQGVLPAWQEDTTVRYRFEVQPGVGSDSDAVSSSALFSYLVGDPGPPEWSAGAIIYQIFPDRFYPGSGRSWRNPGSLSVPHGGTLRGIVEKLDYVAGMGFNCIWLNPFFPGTTYHGYHASDYFSVNPRLGTAEEMRDLVEQAHGRGIRLLLDFVANHWGNDHPSFQEAQQDRSSDYYNWYRWREWPDEYESFFGVKALPQINVDYPPARSHLLEAAEYWLTEYEFDGYRLDYAVGPSDDFWTDFRRAVKRARPDAWIFGEVVDTPVRQRSYWGKMDGCLDFVLQQALRYTFAYDHMSLGQFDRLLHKHESFFPAGFSRPSFLDNHDINRFLWAARGDKNRLKLASLCQFTLSGPPIVYYGTEAGLSQERDMRRADGSHEMAEARLPMVWDGDQDKDLLEHYRWLIQCRREHPVLWHGSRKTAYLDEENGLYAYVREDGQERITVGFNLGTKASSFEAAGQRFSLEPGQGDVRIG